MEAAKDHTQIMKGKRTRRRNRPHSPIMSSSVSTPHCSNESNTFDAALSEAEAEEDQLHDMANCLILLARGHNSKNPPTKPPKILSRDQSRPLETKSMVGFQNQVYQCKTCDRTFPSFQALGGHRASHNKVKAGASDQTVGLQELDQEEATAAIVPKNNLSSSSSSSSPPNLSLQSLFLAAPKKPGLSNKVHECSICGAEFMSGQALGGHMRRHRVSSATTGTTTMAMVANSNTTATATTSLSLGNHQSGFHQSQNQEEEDDEEERLHLAKKSRIVMSLDLDLNLPAPEDGGGSSLHHHLNFPSKQQETPLVLHNLVGCHY